MIWSPPDISSLLGPNSLFPFPCSLSLQFFLFHFHVTVIFFLPFPFLYYLPYSSPFPSIFPPCLWFLLCSFCTTQTLLLSFYLGLVTRDYTPPPSELQCYWTVHWSHLLPPLDFPLSFGPHYYILRLPGPKRGNLPGTMTLTPHLFLFFSVYYRLFYWLSLICSLFQSFISCLFPLPLPFTQLFSPVYPGSAHGIFTML